MFICFNADIDNDVFTTIDTDDFSVEDLTQEDIVNYQNNTGNKVKMFDASLLLDEENEEGTKAVLYNIEDGVLSILVLHIGTDYTLYAEIEIDSDDIELAMTEDENLCIFDNETEEERIIALRKE
jgi:hypothetical protein